MLILDEVLGRGLIGATASLGTRWPAHATSTGKAVLAALPQAERKRILGTRPRLLRSVWRGGRGGGPPNPLAPGLGRGGGAPLSRGVGGRRAGGAHARAWALDG